MNRLIFGKNDHQNIVNITLKDDTLFIYTEDDDVCTEKRFTYLPWVLSNRPVKESSERLKGDQYYKHLTETTCDKFNNLAQSFHRDLWLPRSIEECATLREGFTYYKGMKVEDVSILSFDIETSGLVKNETSRVYLISNTFRKGEKIIRRLFSVEDYPNEREMITDWCDWVRKVNPSIMCGHNVLSYDLPYLSYCYKDDLDLGRDQSPVEFAEKVSRYRKDGSQQYDYHNIRITGREIVDTFFLSMKYDIAREMPSYGLKPVIQHLGLEKADRTFVDASKIWEYYKNREEDPGMWALVKQYATEDSDDALKLFDRMIPAYFYLTQSIPKTLQQVVNEAAGSWLDALMIRSYLQDGYSQPKTSGKAEFEGAISMGRPGVYENVCKADVASLYPSIMLEHNIHDEQKDPNNNMIQMLAYFRNERLKNKKLAKETGDRYYDDMQNAQKICINSLYGFLGAGFLLYNYPKGAAEVTRKGREVLLKAVEWATGYTLDHSVKHIVNEGKEDEQVEFEWTLGTRVSEGRGYTLVNVDTDSFSITNNSPVDKETFRQELSRLNSLYPSLITWENDGIYEKVIVVRAKNYVLVQDGKVKFKGSGLIDQKKEPALLEMLRTIIQALLDDEAPAVPTIYRNYIKEAMSIKFINRWATKKTVTKSVLDPKRLTEQKVLDAIQECISKKVIEGIAEGDKVWVYNSIAGEIQARAKGQPVFYKDGRPKMIPNYILKDVRLWNKDEDRLHYVDRVYATVQILSNVLDMTKIEDYTKKNNIDKLKQLDKSVTL